MKVVEFVNFLNDNDMSEVEVLKERENSVLINFYLDFDKDILAGAKAYANEECKDKEQSKNWYENYYFPYLYDFANDEVMEVIEELTEEFEVAGEFMAFQMKENTAEYVQFMVLLSEEDEDMSIEDAVKDYMS